MLDYFQTKLAEFRFRRDPLHPSNSPDSVRLRIATREDHAIEERTASRFDEFMRRAAIYAGERNIEALEMLQRAVLRPLQSYHILEAFLRPDHGAPVFLNPGRCFGLTEVPGLGGSFDEFVKLRERGTYEPMVAKLSKDMVLPTCWRPSSMTGLFGQCTPWEFDSTNHVVAHWSPLGIFWVLGGNHSIAHGILNGEGEIPVSDVYDLDSLYSGVRFDGQSWLDTTSDRVIGRPRCPEFGIVFELGRMIATIRLDLGV